MEEIENSSLYYQTGIRGNPHFIIRYKNHPLDKLKRKREKTQQKMRAEAEAALEQHRKGGEEAVADVVEDERKNQQQRKDLGRNLQEEEETFNGETVETTTDNDGEEEVDDENPFRPIRIHLATGTLDATRTATNGAQIDFVKDQIHSE